MQFRYPWPIQVVVAVFLALSLAGVDLIVKAWAEITLAGVPDAGRFLDLQLGFNPGVAFSLGSGVPGGAVLALTGALVLGVLVALALSLRTGKHGASLGLLLLSGGALGNLFDRVQDGVVTDYLHSGWWPTFNLADVFICAGVLVLFLNLLVRSPASTHSGPRPV